MNSTKEIINECQLLISQLGTKETTVPKILEKLRELTLSDQTFIAQKINFKDLESKVELIYNYHAHQKAKSTLEFVQKHYATVEKNFFKNKKLNEKSLSANEKNSKLQAKNQRIEDYTFFPIFRKNKVFGIIGFLNFTDLQLSTTELNDISELCKNFGKKIKNLEKKKSKKEKLNFPKIIVKNLLDAVIITNKDLTPIFISPSYYSLTNQKEREIHHINEVETLNFTLDEIEKWEFPKKIIAEFNCLKKKEKIILEHQIQKIPDKHNKTKFYLISSRDVTEREHLIQKMKMNLKKEKDLNTMKTKFISMTSHELRTPLSTILSSVDILELLIDKSKDIDLKETILTHLRKIQIQINRLNRIVSDIFIIDKSINNKLNKELIDLNSITKQIIINYFSKDDLDKIDLNYLNEKVFIKTDKDALINILRNLIENSLKYGFSENNKIIIKTKSEVDFTEFSIEDCGIGIPKIDQPHIFESFYRSGNVHNIKGTGLGLSIVKDLVEKLEGILEFKSQEGKGTKFTIKLKNEKDNPVN